MKKIQIGINGYGRIGRNFHRIILEEYSDQIEVVAINTRNEDLEMRAHLLKYDSLHGKLDADIEIKSNALYVNGKKIQNFTQSDASKIPWKDAGVDIVLESTGRAKTKEDAMKHMTLGAKKILVSAPMKDDTKTIVYGVNHKEILATDTVLSNASCTTNCIVPVLNEVEKKFGIQYGYVTTIHSFTNSQNLLDNTNKDLRRARSAVQSIIPTTSGAMKAIGKVLPKLDKKIDGGAIRIPLATSSLCDITIHTEKTTDKDTLNQILSDAAKNDLQDILGISNEQLVSIDFKTDPRSCILDSTLTRVSPDGKHLQLMVWYDNEWGYAHRLVDMIRYWNEV